MSVSMPRQRRDNEIEKRAFDQRWKLTVVINTGAAFEMGSQRVSALGASSAEKQTAVPVPTRVSVSLITDVTSCVPFRAGALGIAI